MTGTRRAFVAFEVPEQLRSALSDCCDALRCAGTLSKLSPRWVRSENMHVTLRFLGSVTDDSLDALANTLDERFHALEPLATECVSLTGFPSTSRASVFVAQLSVSEELRQLARVVDARATELGSVGETRAYVPHVTLARLKRRGAIPASALATLSAPGALLLSRVVLFESVLAQSGAQYRPLQSWSLELRRD